MKNIVRTIFYLFFLTVEKKKNVKTHFILLYFSAFCQVSVINDSLHNVSIETLKRTCDRICDIFSFSIIYNSVIWNKRYQAFSKIERSLYRYTVSLKVICSFVNHYILFTNCFHTKFLFFSCGLKLFLLTIMLETMKTNMSPCFVFCLF